MTVNGFVVYVDKPYSRSRRKASNEVGTLSSFYRYTRSRQPVAASRHRLDPVVGKNFQSAFQSGDMMVYFIGRIGFFRPKCIANGFDGHELVLMFNE